MDSKKSTSGESSSLRISKAVNAAVICLLGLSISAYLIFAPRPTESGVENRELAKFPSFSFESYFDASYTTQISTWFTDTAPDRDAYKAAITKIRSFYGITPDVVFVGPITPPPNTSEDERPTGEVSDPFAD